MSFFSLVAQNAGIETLSQAVARDAVAAILPRYETIINQIAASYEEGNVQGEEEVNRVNYASVLGAVQDFRTEFWK